MKRLLMATTALCFGAGTAAAQDMGMMDGPSLALSGSAEMGVAGSKDDEARFHTDIDVTFKATGTMNSGVTWSAAVDLDEGGSGAPAHDDVDDDGGVTISISQPEGFGTLTMGDVDGGYDWAIAGAREVGPGSIRDDHEHDGSSGTHGLDGEHDGQILQYNRAIGSGFSLAASLEIDDDKDGEPDTDTDDPIIGIGGKYEMGMGAGNLTLGLGYQMGSFDHGIREGNTAKDGKGAFAWAESNTLDATAIGGSVSLDFTNEGDGVKMIATVEMGDGDGSNTTGTGNAAVTETADAESTHIGLGLGYTVGAISLGLNVGSVVREYTVDENSRTTTDELFMLERTAEGVGFSAAYDLGGGAALQFGVGSSETEYNYTYGDGDNDRSGGGEDGHDYSSDTNKWSLGVAFSF